MDALPVAIAMTIGHVLNRETTAGRKHLSFRYKWEPVWPDGRCWTLIDVKTNRTVTSDRGFALRFDTPAQCEREALRIARACGFTERVAIKTKAARPTFGPHAVWGDRGQYCGYPKERAS